MNRYKPGNIDKDKHMTFWHPFFKNRYVIENKVSGFYSNNPYRFTSKVNSIHIGIFKMKITCEIVV